MAVLFAAESVFVFRVPLTEAGRHALRAVGGEEAFADRRGLQVILIAVLIIPVSVLLAIVIARSRSIGRPEKVGLLGVAVGVVGFALNFVSWHTLDQIPHFYRTVHLIGLGTAAGGVWGHVRERTTRDRRRVAKSDASMRPTNARLRE
jgi:hypothetical protein